jgi:hypothetical protein
MGILLPPPPSSKNSSTASSSNNAALQFNLPKPAVVATNTNQSSAFSQSNSNTKNADNLLLDFD